MTVRNQEKLSTQPAMRLIARRVYYAIKPYLGWRFRLMLRRWLAHRILRRCRHIWPILEGSEKCPPGWQGWPEKKQFALVLTHDVEGERGLRRVQELAELEKKLGFRSSFNLIPEGEYSPSEDLREWLVREGFEVGVHDLHHDGSLYRSQDDFKRQMPRINEHLRNWNAKGFRAGFMFHNLDWIGELNVEYDASTFDTDPFEPQPDGVATIFPFWVPGRNGRPGYVELPYTLPQDSTVFLLFREQNADLWKRKLDWVASHGGMALVNVHPDYINFGDSLTADREFPLAHYKELLEHIKAQYKNKCWNVLPSQLARWFKEANCPAGLVHSSV